MLDFGDEALGWRDAKTVAQQENRLAAVVEAEMQVRQRRAGMAAQQLLEAIHVAIREALARGGIDVDRLDRDLAGHASDISATLSRNNDQAAAFEFHGTPSFIVGKFRVPGVLTMPQFTQVIADARKAAAPNATKK